MRELDPHSSPYPYPHGDEIHRFSPEGFDIYQIKDGFQNLAESADDRYFTVGIKKGNDSIAIFDRADVDDAWKKGHATYNLFLIEKAVIAQDSDIVEIVNWTRYVEDTTVSLLSSVKTETFNPDLIMTPSDPSKKDILTLLKLSEASKKPSLYDAIKRLLKNYTRRASG